MSEATVMTTRELVTELEEGDERRVAEVLNFIVFLAIVFLNHLMNPHLNDVHQRVLD